MVKLPSKNTAPQVEESTITIANYNVLREQVTSLVDLIQVQGRMIAQLQMDILLIQTENQNWTTLFQWLMPRPREIQEEASEEAKAMHEAELEMQAMDARNEDFWETKYEAAEKGYREMVLREGGDPLDDWQEETDRMNTFYSGEEK